MAEHKTSKLRPVNHEHDPTDLHAADQALAQEFMAKLFPQAQVVNPATLKYNCHGFALAPSHLAWYNFPDLFLSDDYTGTPMESPQLGDILVYSLDGVLTHSAVVIEVNGGKIVRVQSKWGGVAEVRHPTSHVPDVYGEPIVLLRPQPGVPLHPAVGTLEEAAAAGGAEESEAGKAETSSAETRTTEADTTEAATVEAGAAETVSLSEQAPKRFRLMLASTPEVRRRILGYSPTAQVFGTKPAEAGPTPETLEAAAITGVSETSSAESTQDDIQKALEQLSAPDTQFRLLLASTPDVLRAAASRLQPVKDLLAIGKTKPQEAGQAVLEYFERPEIQEDEQVAGLVLFLMAQVTVKEAVAPIARYLQTGTFSTFNGGLAVEALGAAVALVNA